MAPLQQQFDLAVKLIQSLPKDGPIKQSDDVRLKLYSHYKQITVGKCNIEQPLVVNVIARAKWDAWNKLGDMSKDDAMKVYVDEINKLMGESKMDGATEPVLKALEEFKASLK